MSRTGTGCSPAGSARTTARSRPPGRGAPRPAATTLTREAQQLIGYRTRELTALLPGTARTMRRMARMAGRSDDMLIVRGVNVFPTQIEEILLADPRLSAHYVLELRRDGRMDDLTV